VEGSGRRRLRIGDFFFFFFFWERGGFAGWGEGGGGWAHFVVPSSNPN
jgi:hypothetical protein